MKKENFDEMLKDALREYVKDTEAEPTEKVKFSKRHERNMEAIFKSIENGTLGNFEVEPATEIENVEVTENVENTENTKIITINKFNFRRLTKVAIFVIFALIISLVAPGIEAWRTDDLNLYGENQDEYAWILPNDISEMLEVDSASGDEYLKIFGYLPEGAKIEKALDSVSGLFIKIGIYDKYANLRIYSNNNPTIDLENLISKEILLNGRKIEVYFNDDIDVYVWTNELRMYRLYGNLNENEMKKIIEKINYEKIEIFF